MRKILLILTALTFVLSAPVWADEKPSFDVNWYGYVKLDAAYDQNPTSHGNFAMWANPVGQEDDDAQFNMTHKQSRFGFAAVGKNLGDVNVSGKVELDLYGSAGGENKASVLFRHAFFTVRSQGFELLAGQTWDLISPLNPSTVNYPVLWGCGNTQYRRPQVRLSYQAQTGDNTSVTVAGGFFRTIGSDDDPAFSFSLALGEEDDKTDDGTDAGIPSFQTGVDVNHKFESGSSLRVGVAGLWGRLNAETNMGNKEQYDSWGVFGHFQFALASGVGVSAEAFSGSNLGSYMGGITNTNRVEGLKAYGGWGSLWFKPVPKVKFSFGAGVDNPDDEELSTGNRSYNQAYFGNVSYSPVAPVTLAFEVSHWRTDYIEGDRAKVVRAQSAFILNF